MTDAMQVKEALADRLQKFGVETLLSRDEIKLIVASLRAPSPAALDPVTVETCAKALEAHEYGGSGPAGIIRALLSQPAPTGKQPTNDQFTVNTLVSRPSWCTGGGQRGE